MLRTFIFSLFISCISYSQQLDFKPFSGALTYKVELIDSTLKKGVFQYYMRLYTNDTLVRIENESVNFGKQILIRHLNLNKQYLLLEYDNKKYAIQQIIPKDTMPSKYTFTLINKSKKFAKKKSFLAQTKITNSTFIFPTYYCKELNPKYLDILKGIKGLPTQYFLPSESGILRYTLIEVQETQLPQTTFLFSKDYTKITFDEFINIVNGTQKKN